MIAGLLVLLACQLAGDVLVRATGLPVPGPVVGMVLLLAVLQLREPRPDGGLARVCEGLLRHLQLFFVPAGVGILPHAALAGAAVVPLVAGLLVSWLAALLTAAAVATALLRAGRARRA